MDDDLSAIFDELASAISLGPGENPTAKSKVTSRLDEIARHSALTSSLRGRLVSLREGLDRWFSPRRWNANGDGGSRIRMGIQQDIAVLRSGLQRPGRP